MKLRGTKAKSLIAVVEPGGRRRNRRDVATVDRNFSAALAGLRPMNTASWSSSLSASTVAFRAWMQSSASNLHRSLHRPTSAILVGSAFRLITP